MKFRQKFGYIHISSFIFSKITIIIIALALLSGCGDEGTLQPVLSSSQRTDLALKIDAELSTFVPLSTGDAYNVPLIADVRTSLLAERVMKSTVYVIADRAEGPSQGTGFVVGQGLIATAYHVVATSGTAQARFQAIDSDEYYDSSTVAALDANRDLIIFHVEGYDAPSLPLADSNNVFLGQPIFVMGNPRGLKGTFSSGIVSGIRENVFQGSNRGKQIQITAPVSTGNSGSPVINDRGEVVGMASSMVDGLNDVTFITPSNYITALLLLGTSTDALDPPSVPPAGIVPGVSLSGVRIGMSTAQVKQAIGNPTSQTTFLEQPYLGYTALGLGVVTKNDKVILIIARAGNTATTADGNGIGSTQVSLHDELGAPERTTNGEYYWSRGIALFYDANLRVNIVMVFDTDELRAIL